MSFNKIKEYHIPYKDKADGQIIDPVEWNANFIHIEQISDENRQIINEAIDSILNDGANTILIDETVTGTKEELKSVLLHILNKFGEYYNVEIIDEKLVGKMDAGEGTLILEEANTAMNTAKEASQTALEAKEAAEKARDEAKNFVGDGYSYFCKVTIPADRMKGDIDGDGQITSIDADLANNHTKDRDGVNGDLITNEIDFACGDVTGDGTINTSDVGRIRTVAIKTAANNLIYEGSLGEPVLGNWFVNPNYATEEAQFYTDIAVGGMNSTSSALVTIKGTFESGFFTKAECVDGAVRIYAKLCPIEAVEAVVVYGSGDGSAAITVTDESIKNFVTTSAMEAYVNEIMTVDEGAEV